VHATRSLTAGTRLSRPEEIRLNPVLMSIHIIIRDDERIDEEISFWPNFALAKVRCQTHRPSIVSGPTTHRGFMPKWIAFNKINSSKAAGESPLAIP